MEKKKPARINPTSSSKLERDRKLESDQQSIESFRAEREGRAKSEIVSARERLSTGHKILRQHYSQFLFLVCFSIVRKISRRHDTVIFVIYPTDRKPATFCNVRYSVAIHRGGSRLRRGKLYIRNRVDSKIKKKKKKMRMGRRRRRRRKRKWKKKQKKRKKEDVDDEDDEEEETMVLCIIYFLREKTFHYCVGYTYLYAKFIEYLIVSPLSSFV